MAGRVFGHVHVHVHVYWAGHVYWTCIYWGCIAWQYVLAGYVLQDMYIWLGMWCWACMDGPISGWACSMIILELYSLACITGRVWVGISGW